ncbi:hypothetical protein [Halomonas sp. E19]|uniref:hypothetical protein n=1 Tax=Halomonas sp. E19 TaxID=3397247 RepID=UPI004034631D
MESSLVEGRTVDEGAELIRLDDRLVQGTGMEILWPHALALVATGIPLYLAAWLIFRRFT